MEIPKIVISTTEGFDVYPDEGIIVNKRIGGNNKTNQSPTTKNTGGYLIFYLSGKQMKVHRYIFETFWGEKIKPGLEVNHIDHNITNNKIDNLEVVTHAQNQQWQKPRKERLDKGLYKGVYANGKGWRALIQFEGKRHYVGTFKTPKEAAMAYNRKAQEFNDALGCKYILNEI